MNITGLYLPAPVAQPGFIYSVIALGVAIVMTLIMKRWAEKRQLETGGRTHLGALQSPHHAELSAHQ